MSPIFAEGQTERIPELAQAKASGTKMLHVVEGWLGGELQARRAKAAKRELEHGPASLEASVVPNRTPLMPSKHLAFFR